MSVDASDLWKLSAEFSRGQKVVLREVTKVVSKGSLNVKRQIQKDFLDSPHFGSRKPGGVVANVKYNLETDATGARAEIAPFVDNDGFGSLVGIAIYGGSRGGGTVADPLVALQAEAPKFVSALEALGGKILHE